VGVWHRVGGLDAGADHVCLQVVPAVGDVLTALRAIAERLGL
jgi:hypothetical protein